MANLHVRFHDFDMRHEYEIRVEDDHLDARAARIEIAELKEEVRGVRGELLQKERGIGGLGNEIMGVREEVRSAREEARGTREDEGAEGDLTEGRLMGEIQDLRTRDVEREQRVTELLNDFDDLRKRHTESEALLNTMRDDINSLGHTAEGLSEENRGLIERVTWLEMQRPVIEEEAEPENDIVVDEKERVKSGKGRCKWSKFYTRRKRPRTGKELALRFMECTIT
ncbi:1e73c687-4d68-4a41-8946-d2097b5f44d5-CDS [Sclerotinia trifoliorum]|uniref:1e73c687-4d68-4a41-8946-d2097b5f44d5-CDS n=1 Tax=Sclerotinia trifoliorum TaxID=28548 RepID=A0A8H2VTA0_9HELO|nr:1e73c687-4d68-4a41-8946-d2097b5f44d5-CDS [Sclerotinia trifoliorum]